MSEGPELLLREGAATGVFPQARAVVWLEGRRVLALDAGGAGPETRFDLASLTKVVATTSIFLRLWAAGELEPATPLARVLPGAAAARAGLTVADLLYHRGGLPPFVPLFGPVLRAHPELLAPDCPPEVREVARREALAAALAVGPVEPPRVAARYGDLGFVLLGELLARLGGAPLDALFDELVAAPLGLGAGFRRLSRLGPAGSGDREHGGQFAPTGTTRPREPAPGQEGLWEWPPSAPSRPGEVDDDNAWVLDGVAGHSGLFATGDELAAFGQAVLEELDGAARLAPAAYWCRALARDAATAGSTRAMGFDTCQPGDAPGSAGGFVGQVPPGAVGHLGFTGTSLWVDRGRRLVVALCTNRVAAGRAETRIRAFRPRFHDAVVQALGVA